MICLFVWTVWAREIVQLPKEEKIKIDFNCSNQSVLSGAVQIKTKHSGLKAALNDTSSSRFSQQSDRIELNWAHFIETENHGIYSTYECWSVNIKDNR